MFQKSKFLVPLFCLIALTILEFIDSVMVRLKEFLQFDTSETELDVKYQASKYEHAGGLSPNFHFYCSVKYRDGNKKIPKGPIIRYGNY